MKTAEKVAGELAKNIITNHGWGSKELLIESLKVFEAEIREDERETRVKELTSMGEFKTAEEASEYCRLHGIGGIGWKSEIFTIAGALMDARKDQVNKCADLLKNLYLIQKPIHIGYISLDDAKKLLLKTIEDK